ncbi:MAG: hypothetical protein R2860_05990 [Desulfobacterales bacterium]
MDFKISRRAVSGLIVFVSFALLIVFLFIAGNVSAGREAVLSAIMAFSAAGFWTRPVFSSASKAAESSGFRGSVTVVFFDLTSGCFESSVSSAFFFTGSGRSPGTGLISGPGIVCSFMF